MKYEKDGVVLEIIRDDCPEDPREWSNIGTMVCWHFHYNLGDEHNYSNPSEFYKDLVIKHYTSAIAIATLVTEKRASINDFNEDEKEDIECLVDVLDEEALLFLVRRDKEMIMLPLYLYDHSGITMNTTGFHCPWDSEQVGWIYCTKKRFREETGYTEKQLFEEGKAEEILRNEVKIYDDYLTGNVWGFKLYQKVVCPECGNIANKLIDSCWGFYGSDYIDQMMEHITKGYHKLLEREAIEA